MNSEKDHHADVTAVDATTNKVTAEAAESEGHNRFFGAQSTRTTKKQETASTKPSTKFLNMIQLQPLASQNQLSSAHLKKIVFSLRRMLTLFDQDQHLWVAKPLIYYTFVCLQV